MDNDFLGGVVEGFYGQPWTHAQRLQLFGQMADWGLNTYFYAPKDDLKHRAIWREIYNEQELSSLAALIDSCQQHKLRFIYGLSPGLDIRFANPSELEAIKRRFEQLINVGAQHFALLFDDLPGELHAEDRRTYESVAAAQSAVTNGIFNWVREKITDSRLLFCPTPYCDRMDRWQLGGTEYLETVGRLLAPAIDILWTGPEIISREISVESIRNLSQRIQRPPVIWDNLHANDYDLRRLYCGPYSGRPPELLQNVRGILSNPNNEFPINYIPLRTLAHYLRGEAEYNPREAFLTAVAEWNESFQTVAAEISLDDVILLADCYYLPYAEGPEAEKLQTVVAHLIDRPVDSWGDFHEEFLLLHRRVQRLFDGLTELTNRELFYAWSRRVWEFKEELDLIQDFLARKKAGADEVSGIGSETHLPGTYRAGMVARLQRRLSMDEGGLFYAGTRDQDRSL
jgi:protein O-GlcNAcase/histone acetyltransferase